MAPTSHESEPPRNPGRFTLVFDNPVDGTVVQGSVFTNNRIAVTGKTRELVGIYEK
jgi:hypothetical protein